MTKMPDGWLCEEAGWWSHDILGGVCREADRNWYAYPKSVPESERMGPFDTANAAATALQQPATIAVA